MELTKEQVNQILTEAQGKCGHEPIVTGKTVRCAHCRLVFGEDGLIDLDKWNKANPSPTTNWQDYGECLEWAKKQDWWKGFCTALVTTPYGCEPILLMANPETGSRAIAEFLEEREDIKKKAEDKFWRLNKKHYDKIGNPQTEKEK